MLSRAKGMPYGREPQLLAGLEQLEAAPSQALGPPPAVEELVSASAGAPTPMQTGEGLQDTG